MIATLGKSQINTMRGEGQPVAPGGVRELRRQVRLTRAWVSGSPLVLAPLAVGGTTTRPRLPVFLVEDGSGGPLPTAPLNTPVQHGGRASWHVTATGFTGGRAW